MKKILSLSLSLLLLFSLLLPCTVAFAEGEEEAGSIDPDLVGVWSLDDKQENGKTGLKLVSLLKNDMVILPDGRLYTTQYTSFTGSYKECEFYSLGNVILKASDGETNLGELYPETILSIYKAALAIPELEVTEAEIAEMEEQFSKITDLKVTYKVTDFNPKKAKSYIADSDVPLYKADHKDGLVLHITGNYHDNPLSSTPIDTTLSFCLYHNGFPTFITAYLYGEWTDTNNNIWEFHYALNNKNNLDLTGSMTDAGGTVYQASEAFFRYSAKGLRYSDESNTLYFSFTDFSSPEYTIASLDANHISLTSNGGNLDLTRK